MSVMSKHITSTVLVLKLTRSIDEAEAKLFKEQAKSGVQVKSRLGVPSLKATQEFAA
ncbi:hypothetical protein K2173_012388 [Erythroxylum novogranatense]|uniref:Stress-response A/B barrel domain-containing protein n=1 Tax=Erythroxylum novogranatense TaxID=1862640 RepID=A0AAV8UDC0_9ROSI|nr:hypothetical protein K2173_012388 [Erythroxylum novogranatense]